MEIIPVINCDDLECVKEKLLKANEILSETPKKIHIDISDGVYALKPEWNDPAYLENFLAENNLEFNIGVHLMMKHPSSEIEKWSLLVKKAAVPIDCEEDARKMAKLCREKNITPCLSIPPNISAKSAIEYADSFDEFQILAVSPGPSGQKMCLGTFEKIEFIKDNLPSAIIEIDGGVNPEVIPHLKEAGADIVLSGSYIFGAENPRSAYLELKSLA
ncbi:MAG: hypothetical protein WC519_01295 [Parcubacteria group bacterium]|jgi:ribulose-phosphate 3-epimerase